MSVIFPTVARRLHEGKHVRQYTLYRWRQATADPHTEPLISFGASRDTLTRHQRLHKRDEDMEGPAVGAEAADASIESAEPPQKVAKKARRARTNSTQSSSGDSVTVTGASASHADNKSKVAKRDSMSDSDQLAATKTGSSTASSITTVTSGASSSLEGHEAISPAFAQPISMDSDGKPTLSEVSGGKTDIPTPPSSGFTTATLLYDFASWHNQTRNAAPSVATEGMVGPGAPTTALGLDLGAVADQPMDTAFGGPENNGGISPHSDLPPFVRATQKGFHLHERPELNIFPVQSNGQQHNNVNDTSGNGIHGRSSSFSQPSGPHDLHTFLGSPQQQFNGQLNAAANPFTQQQQPGSFLAGGASGRGYLTELLQFDPALANAHHHSQQSPYLQNRDQYDGSSLGSHHLGNAQITAAHHRSYSVDDAHYFSLNTALLQQQQVQMQQHIHQHSQSGYTQPRPSASLSPLDSASYLSLACAGSPGSLGSPLTDMSSNDYGSMPSSAQSLPSSLPTLSESFSSFYSYSSEPQLVEGKGTHGISAFKGPQSGMSATISGDYAAAAHGAGLDGSKLTAEQEYRIRMQRLLGGPDQQNDDVSGMSRRRMSLKSVRWY